MNFRRILKKHLAIYFFLIQQTFSKRLYKYDLDLYHIYSKNLLAGVETSKMFAANKIPTVYVQFSLGEPKV